MRVVLGAFLGEKLAERIGAALDRSRFGAVKRGLEIPDGTLYPIGVIALVASFLELRLGLVYDRFCVDLERDEHLFLLVLIGEFVSFLDHSADIVVAPLGRILNLELVRRPRRPLGGPYRKDPVDIDRERDGNLWHPSRRRLDAG
eukprot:CAMPEP_0170171556 /NCGR_PEP_ID=MMETSP0040_2-20121228/4713_1 /TAXON_ID=641309 /ORGANISM="Lotharella oceanica, Strain CCMP622" /LENGTH=144 /DNA_ID=CAMNT_0010411681 /DNA_START=1160 /DNA_END=1594 /DNA_ORIENTATION=+